MPKSAFMLQRALSIPAHLLHNLEMCLSKFNLLSISKPKSVTLFSELISLPSIVNYVGLFVCPFLSIIID